MVTGKWMMVMEKQAIATGKQLMVIVKYTIPAMKMEAIIATQW